jgi:O-antigen/teichoic acid export membrane protein
MAGPNRGVGARPAATIRAMWTPRGRIADRAGRVDSATAGAVLAGFWVQGALLFTGVVSARILGVDERGHFALLWLIALSIAAIGNLGLPLASVFFIAADHGRTRPIVRSLAPVAGLQLVALLAIQGLVLVLYLPGQPSEVVNSGLLTLPWSASIVLQLYGLALFQGQARFLAFNVARVVPVTIYSITAIVLALAGAGTLFSLTLAIVASNVIAGVGTVTTALWSLSPNPDGAVAPKRSELFKFGLKALLGSFSLIETLQVDQTFVGIVLTPAALGLYVVATSFTNLARIIVTNVGMVAYPRVASTRDPAVARRRIWLYFNATLIGSVALGVVLEASIGWLIPFVFGHDFSPAVPLARILILGSVLLCARRILSDAVRGAGFPGLGTIAEVASWAWLVPALILLVHLSGARGAAWAAASSYAFSVLLLLFLVFRREELRPAWASRLLKRAGIPGRGRRAAGPDVPLPESLGTELVPESLETAVPDLQASPADSKT